MNILRNLGWKDKTTQLKSSKARLYLSTNNSILPSQGHLPEKQSLSKMVTSLYNTYTGKLILGKWKLRLKWDGQIPWAGYSVRCPM